MLQIQDDVLQMQTDMRELVQQIARHDRDLASQLRRSAQAVALGLGEGMGARAGNRRLAYERALKEARECTMAIEVAQRWQYIQNVNTDTLNRLDKIRATLYRLSTPR